MAPCSHRTSVSWGRARTTCHPAAPPPHHHHHHASRPANYVKEVQGSTSEVEIPASVIAEAKAEILAMRARDGNDDTSLPDFPTKVSLASL